MAQFAIPCRVHDCSGLPAHPPRYTCMYVRTCGGGCASAALLRDIRSVADGQRADSYLPMYVLQMRYLHGISLAFAQVPAGSYACRREATRFRPGRTRARQGGTSNSSPGTRSPQAVWQPLPVTTDDGVILQGNVVFGRQGNTCSASVASRRVLSGHCGTDCCQGRAEGGDRQLFADERCLEAALTSLRSTDAGRLEAKRRERQRESAVFSFVSCQRGGRGVDFATDRGSDGVVRRIRHSPEHTSDFSTPIPHAHKLRPSRIHRSRRAPRVCV